MRTTDRRDDTRVFKTAWFAKQARKAGIEDSELHDAVREAMKGQAVDLGGGVYKKRLKRNLYRSIVLAKGARFWILEYLFAKKDRANISPDELAGFRTLASAYSRLTDDKLAALIETKKIEEIAHDGTK